MRGTGHDSEDFGRLAVVGLLIAGAAGLAQTPPPKQPTLVDAAAKDYGTRPVAYIYDGVPVTRAELAEFLIARGGYEKVELLVNKKIIETEAAKRGITVTPQQMEAALAKDLEGITVSKEQFINVVLSKYGKSYYEWMEDVVRPRLILEAMCKQDVKVAEADLKAEYERLYGEKRRIQIIIWPKGDDLKSITRLWSEIRSNENEFDRVARQQANPSLGATAGHVNPIGRNLAAEEKVVEERAFAMKAGDVSEIFQTTQGYMVIKLREIIPADTKVKLDDVRTKIYDSVYQLKVSQEIPKCFDRLKKAAKPDILLNGPPSQWKFEKTNRELAEDVLKGQQPVQPASGTAPPPVPVPPKPLAGTSPPPLPAPPKP